jgi:hypothetical protein
VGIQQFCLHEPYKIILTHKETCEKVGEFRMFRFDAKHAKLAIFFVLLCFASFFFEAKKGHPTLGWVIPPTPLGQCCQIAMYTAILLKSSVK